MLQHAGQVDRERLGLALQQALRREHVSDLGRADAESQRAESAVGARVRIAADDCLAGLSRPELRRNYVHDAAFGTREIPELDPEIGAVLFHLDDLLGRGRLADDLEILERGDGNRRDRVIECSEAQIGPAHGQAFFAQHVEGLRARHLMDEMQIDIEDGGAIVAFGADDMRVPYLVEQRFRGH